MRTNLSILNWFGFLSFSRKFFRFLILSLLIYFIIFIKTASTCVMFKGCLSNLYIWKSTLEFGWKKITWQNLAFLFESWWWCTCTYFVDILIWLTYGLQFDAWHGRWCRYLKEITLNDRAIKYYFSYISLIMDWTQRTVNSSN